ncbi:MAG: SPOR domain-containing protein [Bacteroidales bacterium]|jgi:hypothetical protein|nr:SPOR domain-containing protein [Bacteroidales bacterium]
MRRLLVLIALVSVCVCAQAQSRGSVQITGDTKVTTLVEKHIAFNEKIKTVPGYRIQIANFSGVNSKSQAFAKKQQFLEKYSDLAAYVVFEEPNFKVKVGDFVSQLDAYVFLQKIKADHPAAKIIKDNVYPVRWSPEELMTEDDPD